MQLTPLQTKSPLTAATRILTTTLLDEVYLTPNHVEFNIKDHVSDAGFPWAASFAQDPERVTQAVSTALFDLMHAVPDLDVAKVHLDQLPDGRAKTHLQALKALWQKLGTLPPELATIRHVLSSEAIDALEPLPIVGAEPCAFASPAQRDLHAALIRHHGCVEEQPVVSQASGSLKHLQTNLLTDAAPHSLDQTVSFSGLRDPIEEAEFAAARIQQACDNGMSAADFGILAPDDPTYASALRTAFERVGLALSGAAAPQTRDTPGEFLTLALTCLKSHNSAMARASLCQSLLMPWSEKDGILLADAIMFGGLKRIIDDIEHAEEVLGLLRPVQSPAALFTRLDMLSKLTNAPSDLAPCIGGLRAVSDGGTIDWHEMERAAAPRGATSESSEKSVEGVSVFSENALPWRPVKELIVLGMTGGHWPRPARSNPFFTESEFALIEAYTGLALTSQKRVLARGMELFRQQIGAAQDRLTLCASARDLTGKKQSASVALTLIAKSLGELDDPLRLLCAPTAADATICTHPVVAELSAPKMPANDLLPIGGNLLTLRREEDTSQMKPQSVSRLETMLVSPLAWALGEIGAEERIWGPQSLDVMLLGTLVHDVLEHGFVAHQDTASDEEIMRNLPQLFTQAIARNAPWLEEENWSLERSNLLVEVQKSTLAWAGFLRTTGAKVIGNEKHLQSSSPSLNIRTHGYADCLLELPDGRVLVVDHKRSKSAGRLKRLEARSDLQVTLYKEMLLHPQGDDALDLRSTEDANIIAAYHTTLDNTVIVSHNTAPIDGTLSIPGDISSKAVSLLSDRIKDLTVGMIPLNTTADTAVFEKDFGLTPYALEGNRLVTAFMTAQTEDTA